MKFKTLKKVVIFKSTPYHVYEAFMDTKQHALITGFPATISRANTGSFTSYNGEVSGTNIDLIQDRKIFQHWRMNDWLEGHYASLLMSIKEVTGGTKLIFVQTGIPKEHYEKVEQTWNDMLGKITIFLEEKKV